jgi:hypothetical protein
MMQRIANTVFLLLLLTLFQTLVTGTATTASTKEAVAEVVDYAEQITSGCLKSSPKQLDIHDAERVAFSFSGRTTSPSSLYGQRNQLNGAGRLIPASIAIHCLSRQLDRLSLPLERGTYTRLIRFSRLASDYFIFTLRRIII